jgi:hypothetical protein
MNIEIKKEILNKLFHDSEYKLDNGTTQLIIKKGFGKALLDVFNYIPWINKSSS